MLSKKTKYGLHAVIYLTRNYQKGPILISALAKKERIPQKFLEAILLDLKHHGILQSKKGKGGGYFLGKPPAEITVGQVVRVLEGPLAPVSCVSQIAYQKCAECKDETKCEIRLVMKDVRDAIANILDKETMEDLIQRKNSALENQILNFSI